MEQLSATGRISACTIRDRAAHAAFGQPLVTNMLRGLVVEAIVATVLEPDWRWCSADYAAWDFDRSDGLRLEVKQSAVRQSWAQTKTTARPATFDIAPRTGRYDGDVWLAEVRRWADLYVFAHHHVADDTADHRDPAQWTFYVVLTTALPTQKTVGLAKVRMLATGCGVDDLKMIVALAAAGGRGPLTPNGASTPIAGKFDASTTPRQLKF
ncbi:hypothetical protein [Sphingomonas montana]|uniref:hypothetical protein n=1 Tax=Sphingomonas montana TaxID=1843236 RepID=UPI00101AD149|nr:hypothetical protein [Sphingomonas montana]